MYLTLPREPLSAAVSEPTITVRQVPAAPHPDPAAIAQLADWISAAKSPLIITSASGADTRAVAPLARLAERAAIAVVSHNARNVCLPSSHPMHAGFDSGPLVGEADLIVVIECDAPWYPNMQSPPAGGRVVHIGEDPSFVRYPMRSFPSDLSIEANAAVALEALDAAVAQRIGDVSERRNRIAARGTARREKAAAQTKPGSTITVPHLSRAIGEAVGTDAIIFNEYPLSQEHCPREAPGTFFGVSAAGGLGWGLGAALGAKLAAPDKLVVATLGDGAYMFANPMVGHWVAEKFDLPILTVIFNNSRYGAVRKATLSMFKDGAAGEDDGNFLADLSPSPPFDEFVTAQGGHGERVEKPGDLEGALARARDAVTRERKQALVNVICPY